MSTKTDQTAGVRHGMTEEQRRDDQLRTQFACVLIVAAFALTMAALAVIAVFVHIYMR